MNLEKLANLDNVSLDLEATKESTGEKIKDTFCNDWGTARPVVENLVNLVKNPIVKLIINIVLSIGDGIKGKICPAPVTETTTEAQA